MGFISTEGSMSKPSGWNTDGMQYGDTYFSPGTAPAEYTGFQAPATTNWNDLSGGLGQDALKTLSQNLSPEGSMPSGYNTPGFMGGTGAYLPDGWSMDGGPGIKSANGWYWSSNGTDRFSGYDPSTKMAYNFGMNGKPIGNEYVKEPGVGDMLLASAAVFAPFMLGGLGAAGAGAGAATDGTSGVLGALNSMPAWATAGPGADAAAGLGTGLLGSTGAAAGGGFLSQLGSQLGNKVGNMGLSQIFGALTGGGGQTGGGGNSNGLFGTGLGLNDILGLAGGVNDAYQQNKASNTMIDWLHGQQSKLDSLYDPNGPMAKYMWEQMSRQDAAAGRNSQYGPRTADFLGKYAEQYGNQLTNFTTGTSRGLADALTRRAGAYSGLSYAGQQAARNAALGGLGNILGQAGSGMSPPNPFAGSTMPGSGDASGFSAYDPGYVDPSSVQYSGGFQFPDAGQGDWGPAAPDYAQGSGNILDLINGFV